MKENNLIGCCGIFCGLCSRFHSKAKSRCLGCGPDGHCSYCSIYRCCVRKRELETCADCHEFPCDKFAKWFDADSFVTHRKCLDNIQQIKSVGVDEFLPEQIERKRTLEMLLEWYNPGRCATLYCQAATLMNIESLKNAITQVDQVKEDKARTCKKLIQEFGEKENISLNLRK